MKTLLLSLLFCFTYLVSHAQISNNSTTNDLCSGYIIGSAMTSIAYITDKKYPELYGLCGTLAFSLGKQIYDVYHLNQHVDYRDIFGTVAGGLAGTITVGIVIDKKATPKVRVGVW